MTALASRVDEIRGRAASFFEDFLWDPELGKPGRLHARKLGFDNEETLRTFRIGYAPPGWFELPTHLQGLGYEPPELDAAGLVRTSDRGRAHVHFRSRVMFPITDAAGTVLGFAGLATHPGPSWPEWTTSPDGEGFSRSGAIFGIESAADGDMSAGVVLLDDPVEVLRRHREKPRPTLAAVRARIGPSHLAQVAELLDTTADGIETETVAASAGAPRELIVTRSPGAVAAPSTLFQPTAEKAPRAPHLGGIRPDPMKIRPTWVKVVLNVLRAALGVGIPLLWLAILGFHTGEGGSSAPLFVGAIGGVAVSYMLIALVVAVVSGRVRMRSRGRRMRAPWERGGTEWQPPAWTYHFAEDLAIGAAVVSVFVCLILFLTIGGFIKH